MIENRSPATVYSLFELINIITDILNIKLANNYKNTNLTAFYSMDEILKNGNLFNKLNTKFLKLASEKNKLIGLYYNYPFKPIISDYYRTNSYSSYSLNMINYSTKQRKNNHLY